MKFLEVHESQEFQQTLRFMEGTAMIESAVDNNQAVYRREKAEHQETSLDSSVYPMGPLHKARSG